jgi:hypothetical protein
MASKKWDNSGATRYSKPKRVGPCECAHKIAARNMRTEDPNICLNCSKEIKPEVESDERDERDAGGGSGVAAAPQ